MSDWYGKMIERKAREKYRCVWCGEGILIGEMYAYESSCGRGMSRLHRWHRECFPVGGPFSDDGGFTLYAAERPSPP